MFAILVFDNSTCFRFVKDFHPIEWHEIVDIEIRFPDVLQEVNANIDGLFGRIYFESLVIPGKIQVKINRYARVLGVNGVNINESYVA